MSAIARLKKFLIGRPMHSEHAPYERLGVLLGLAVFAGDALSSVVYALEAVW